MEGIDVVARTKKSLKQKRGRSPIKVMEQERRLASFALQLSRSPNSQLSRSTEEINVVARTKTSSKQKRGRSPVKVGEQERRLASVELQLSRSPNSTVGVADVNVREFEVASSVSLTDISPASSPILDGPSKVSICGERRLVASRTSMAVRDRAQIAFFRARSSTEVAHKTAIALQATRSLKRPFDSGLVDIVDQEKTTKLSKKIKCTRAVNMEQERRPASAAPSLSKSAVGVAHASVRELSSISSMGISPGNFTMHQCPSQVRIRGGQRLMTSRAWYTSGAATCTASPRVNEKVGSVTWITLNSKQRLRKERSRPSSSHIRKLSLVASSYRMQPKSSRNTNPSQLERVDADFAPELLSDDNRFPANDPPSKFHDSRRGFLAVGKRRVQEPTKSKTSNKSVVKVLKEPEPRSSKESIYGNVSGVEEGYHCHYFKEMVKILLHRRLQSGIDYIPEAKSSFRNGKGQRVSVAVSVVCCGGYADDKDMGDILIYTGQGGNQAKGSKLEPRDQELERGNLALRNSCDLDLVVRVIRGRKFKKEYESTQGRKMRFNNQSPSGFVYFYCGLYRVKKYYQEQGISGCLVWKYKLVRQSGQCSDSEQLMRYNGPNLPTILCNRGEKILLNDISCGVERTKIRVVGYENDLPSTNFIYTSSLLAAWKVPTPAKSTTSGRWCNCSGTQCVDSCCSCNVFNCGPAYNNDGALLKAKRIVYECGRRCRCSPKCTNKVVQYGLRYDMEVFRTAKKGWGVRSRTFIPRNSFICEYFGEIIQASEADKLESNEYLFQLKIPDSMEQQFGDESRRVGPPASEREGTGDKPKADMFTINAKSHGNVARFINHSCDPNLFVQFVFYDHHDYRLPHVALFAREHIAPYTELTFSYEYELNKVTHNRLIKQKKCHCLAENCRRRL